MKKVLMIAPHFPPSNFAAVHRSRLFAQHLPEFNWEPIILMVDAKYYEEKLDHQLEKLLPQNLRIEKVTAFPVTKPRLIGDIGIRGFFQLYKKAKGLILKDQIDFLYIPIPSFYIALLGRWLHASTGIKYGIDYIDPWVHQFKGSDKILSRHWFSTKIADFLEPIAVKKAALITGVAEGYYKGVIERNPHLKDSAIFGAMPYGGEITDHKKLHSMDVAPYLFIAKPGKIQLVYAGAMLPKAYKPLEAVFRSIKDNPTLFSDVEMHFIGTGKSANDPNGFNVKPIAEKYGLWSTTIFEYPQRIPYLDVLIHLKVATGVFILGSTEPHYTPSKVYQGILSEKPILAILHKESSAVKVLQESGGGIVLAFNGEEEISLIENNFAAIVEKYLAWVKIFNPKKINKNIFEQYSAKSITKQLADLFNLIIQ